MVQPPEHVDVGDGQEVAYASWGRRAAAFLLDVVVVIAAIVGLYVIAWILGGYDAETDTLADEWVAVYVPLIFLGPGVYFWLMTGRYGATLGKLALGIRVRRSEDVGRVGYVRALGREASWLLLAVLTLPLLASILWPLWDARNQTLVDKMASTVVLRA